MSDKNEIQLANGPSGLLHEAPMAVELAEEFGLAPKQVINVLKNSIVKTPKNGEFKGPPTAAELVVVMSVMQKHRLNPMMKELHAWRDNRGELAVMMGYDGWVEMAMRRPTYVKTTYKFGSLVPSPDGKGHKCWEWIQATVHDERRGEMEQVPVYLEEWYMSQGKYPGPWQKQTKHKLKVVAFRLAIRECYGISGIDVRDIEDMMASDAPESPVLCDKAEEAIHRVSMSLADTGESEASEGEIEEDGQRLADQVAEVEEEEPEIEEFRVTMDDGIPCGVSGCPVTKTAPCQDCGTYFCKVHMGKDGLCKICGGGK